MASLVLFQIASQLPPIKVPKQQSYSHYSLPIQKLLLASFCQKDETKLCRLVFEPSYKMVSPTLRLPLASPNLPLPQLTQNAVFKSMRFGVSPIQALFLKSSLTWAELCSLCISGSSSAA